MLPLRGSMAPGPDPVLANLANDAEPCALGPIDRSTFEGCSRLDASLYACHPRLVNGYRKNLSGRVFGTSDRVSNHPPSPSGPRRRGRCPRPVLVPTRASPPRSRCGSAGPARCRRAGRRTGRRRAGAGWGRLISSAEKPARLLVKTIQRPSGEKCGWLFRPPPPTSLRRPVPSGRIQPDLEVAVAVAGEGDPLARRRPVAHRVGPLPLGQPADVRAVGVHDVEVLRPARARIGRRSRWPSGENAGKPSLPGRR